MVLFPGVIFLIALDKRFLYVELNKNIVGATLLRLLKNVRYEQLVEGRRLTEDAARGEQVWQHLRVVRQSGCSPPVAQSWSRSPIISAVHMNGGDAISHSSTTWSILIIVMSGCGRLQPAASLFLGSLPSITGSNLEERPLHPHYHPLRPPHQHYVINADVYDKVNKNGRSSPDK